MHVWVIKVGEPLPVDGASYRPHRIGMLADALLSRGHEVTWWASTLNHQSKTHRYGCDTSVLVRDGYRVNMIHSMGYKSNVSVRRLLDHAQLGERFKSQIQSASKPDLIFCCFPTIELAGAAVDYGRQHGIPVLIDVRDLWPDNFVSLVPQQVRSLAALALTPYVRKTREAFSRCTGVVGISQGYLQYGLNYAGRERSKNDGLFPLGYQRPSVAEDKLQEAQSFLEGCGVDRSRMICWFVGMFGKTYDLNTVIDAARSLSERGVDDVQFVLSGSGESLAQLQGRATGLKNVVFTGRINAVQIAAMSRIADLGLMAYTAGAPQGLPNKLYEYMCAGLPIVSSLQGETKELLQEHRCGVTYTPDDSGSLAEVIQTLRANPLLRLTMGENGRRIFDREFSAETIYARMVDFLEQTVRGRQTEVPALLRQAREESTAKAA